MENKNFRGKVFIVTGAGKGLGKAMAEAALKRGGKVTISDVLVKEGEETTAAFSKQYGKENVYFVKCDVRQEDDVKALWEETVKFFKSEVDVIVNNAGVNHLGGWKRCMDINLIGVMHGTYLAFDKMGRSNGGKGGIIINTASLAGCVGSGDMEPLSYFVGKHAVVALTKSLGVKNVYAKEGIKLACLCPFFTDTDIVKADEEMHKQVIKKYKLKELMPVSRVADGFVNLINAECSNGKALAILPDVTDFYWPQHDHIVLTYLGLGAKLMKMLFPETPIFTSKHQLMFVLATVFMLYVLLNVFFCIAF